MKPKFRITHQYAGYWAFQRYEGIAAGNQEIWRTLDIYSKEIAERQLAKALAKHTVNRCSANA